MARKKKGFVETLFGRRLYLPDINSKQIPRKKAAERAAINAPMQGGQADIIKFAMIQLDQWITQEAPDVHMVMQVHDELIFEIKKSETKKSIETIKEIMSEAAILRVPLVVTVGQGATWADAH